MTRTCVYDRANLGRSGPAPGPRGLGEVVGDLDRLLDAAQIPGPYILVGTSGGGYITAGYAFAHPEQVAGMVFVDTGAPFRNPPREIVEETDPNNPENVERAATTCRWRRMRGPHAGGLATSLCRSWRWSFPTRPSRSRHFPQSGRKCDATLRIRRVGWSSAHGQSRLSSTPVTLSRKTIRVW